VKETEGEEGEEAGQLPYETYFGNAPANEHSLTCSQPHPPVHHEG